MDKNIFPNLAPPPNFEITALSLVYQNKTQYRSRYFCNHFRAIRLDRGLDGKSEEDDVANERHNVADTFSALDEDVVLIVKDLSKVE